MFEKDLDQTMGHKHVKDQPNHQYPSTFYRLDVVHPPISSHKKNNQQSTSQMKYVRDTLLFV